MLQEHSRGPRKPFAGHRTQFSRTEGRVAPKGTEKLVAVVSLVNDSRDFFRGLRLCRSRARAGSRSRCNSSEVHRFSTATRTKSSKATASERQPPTKRSGLLPHGSGACKPVLPWRGLEQEAVVALWLETSGDSWCPFLLPRRGSGLRISLTSTASPPRAAESAPRWGIGQGEMFGGVGVFSHAPRHDLILRPGACWMGAWHFELRG